MTHPRWSTILRRVTTEGPHIDGQMSALVLTVVVVAGISAVAYVDKSMASVSLAPLYFLPLALSALVHPLRISLALSIVCLALHHLVGPVRDVGTQHLTRDAITLLGYAFVVAVVNQLGAQRQRLAAHAERQRDELGNEIQLAAEVQRGILPRSIPQVPGFEFAARMYPAKTVAGDYYGFIELPAGEIAVVIADVSGKGVAAGLLMPSIEVALRMDAARFPSTSDLLQAFNNVVCQITSGHRFISMFYGKLSPQAHSLEYTNAGHNPPLVIRAGTDPSRLDKGGPVLGVLPNSRYESERISLCQGDVLVLYTDGTVEAENPAAEQYSAERLSRTVSLHLQQNASELIETIYTSVIQFRETASLADDLALVLLKKL
jgi:serine phosphatase RsbU (regulator of sigma subunit)